MNKSFKQKFYFPLILPLLFTNFILAQDYVRQKLPTESPTKYSLKSFSDVQKILGNESYQSSHTCSTESSSELPYREMIPDIKTNYLSKNYSGDGGAGENQSPPSGNLLVLVAANFLDASAQDELGVSIGEYQAFLQRAKNFYFESSYGAQDYNITHIGTAAYFLDLDINGQGCGATNLEKVEDEIFNKLLNHGITKNMVGTLAIHLPNAYHCGNIATWPYECAAKGFCRVLLQTLPIAEGRRVFIHELGHTLGLGHANSDPDNDGIVDQDDFYGDYSSNMGSGDGHHNAANYWELGWAQNKLDVTQPGMFKLFPHPGASPIGGGVTALRIVLPNGPDDYWVSIRSNTGWDVNLSSNFTSGLAIHKYKKIPDNMNGVFDQTVLIGNTLFNGSIFKDLPKQVKVTQRNFNPDGSINVEINLGDISSCDGQEPLLEILPIINNQIDNFGFYEAGQYQLKVTNRDDPSNCNKSTFKINKSSNDDFEMSGVLPSSEVEIGPGETKIITFELISILEKPVGDYLASITVRDFDLNLIKHPNVTTTFIYRAPDTSLTTPPLPPLNLTDEIKFDPLLNCHPYVKLDWEHNPGNSGIITYQIFKNNTLETESLTNTKNVYGIPHGTHQLSVKAMNQNNITSVNSNVVTLTVPNITSCLPNFESADFYVVPQSSSSFVRFDFVVDGDDEVERYKIERQLTVGGGVSFVEVQTFNNQFFQDVTNGGAKIFRFHDMIEEPINDPTEYTYRLSAKSITGFWSIIDVKSAFVQPSQWMYPEYTNGSPGVSVDQFWRGPKNFQGQDYIKFLITVNETGVIASYILEEAAEEAGPWQSISTFESDQFAWGGHSQSGNKQFQINHFGSNLPAKCYRLSYISQGNGPVTIDTYCQ